MIKVTARPIPYELLIAPKVFDDERGFFYEIFNTARFEAAIGKPFRVAQGEVFDVAVDQRKSSKSFGHWVIEILLGEKNRQIWSTMRFAQGFVMLSETTEFLYKTTNHYFEPNDERRLAWNNSTLSIRWPRRLTLVSSEKDTQGKALGNTEAFA